MEGIQIRCAAVSDASALSVMARQAFCETFDHYDPKALSDFLDDHYSIADFEDVLRSPNITVLLAFSNEELIGYTKFGASRLPKTGDFIPEFELHQLYVLKAWHGKKIGAELMKRAIEAGRTSNVKTMYLGVWEHNTKAQEFYKRYGFTKVGDYDYLPIGDVTDHEWIMAKLFV